MSKVYYFISITMGLTILMKLAGIPYTGEEQMLNWLGLDPNNFNPTNSLFYVALIAPITGLFTVAAVVGSIFSKESTIRAVLASGILGVGIGAFVGILNYVKDIAQGSQQWVFYIVFMIFAVYITGYVLALIDWWGGTG